MATNLYVFTVYVKWRLHNVFSFGMTYLCHIYFTVMVSDVTYYSIKFATADLKYNKINLFTSIYSIMSIQTVKRVLFSHSGPCKGKTGAAFAFQHTKTEVGKTLQADPSLWLAKAAGRLPLSSCRSLPQLRRCTSCLPTWCASTRLHGFTALQSLVYAWLQHNGEQRRERNRHSVETLTAAIVAKCLQRPTLALARNDVKCRFTAL